ncbi:MAG: S9 family peptidase [Pyrinomonadaceae bacterium]|nr:S9 family peptidase [Pyrinomonadaceae bacterium]
MAQAVHAQGVRPFTVNDLLQVRRVGDPQLSPDGATVAFTITDVDKAANRSRTNIYLMPTAGGAPRQLMTRMNVSVSAPRWSPDGKLLAFVAAPEGTPQIYVMDMAAPNSEPRKVTNISTGAGDAVWSPDGSMLAFVSDIYPECKDDACNKQRGDAAEASKVKAKLADRLLFRHWTSWKEGKRTHIFIVPSAGGTARDMTPGDADAPPFSLGGPTDYAFSPDSKELAFASNTDKDESLSTNGDIFIVPVAGGAPKRITEANRGADLSPLYSPDGRFIAYRSQAKAGFESDRWRLMLYDRKSGQARSITEGFDSYVEGFAFSPDSKKIYFAAPERGRQPLYEITVAGGAPRKIIEGGINDDVKIARDNRTLVFSRNSATKPAEIFRAVVDGSGVTQLTKINEGFLTAFNLRPVEETEWMGAENKKIHGFIVKPPDFDASRKYPMIALIHGGPQGAWNDAWSYRWNPQIYAARGYVVFMPNPRGSTGYGQQFTDDISGDWGGKVFTDIMNGVAEMAAKPYVDRERIGAAGASYGGYMVNWIEGHNDDPRFKFKALVSHAGVFNLASMYGATEELWFTEWEFKGSPWTNPEMYERWSPHRFVKNFKTPMLVTHGEIDYRVPIGEGLQLFTALQRQGVESKLLYFPDEGHWILKPQNSELWHNTVLEWFDKHLKEGAGS